MEPEASSEELAARIEERAVRLAGLLRELDNRPGDLEGVPREQLDHALGMLFSRVMATRALLRRPPDES
jgi:hypothetical protein